MVITIISDIAVMLLFADGGNSLLGSIMMYLLRLVMGIPTS